MARFQPTAGLALPRAAGEGRGAGFCWRQAHWQAVALFPRRVALATSLAAAAVGDTFPYSTGQTLFQARSLPAAVAATPGAVRARFTPRPTVKLRGRCSLITAAIMARSPPCPTCRLLT